MEEVEKTIYFDILCYQCKSCDRNIYKGRNTNSIQEMVRGNRKGERLCKG